MVQRASTAPDCTVYTVTSYIKGSNTRARHLYAFCLLIIRLRWRWIMMTVVSESDYVCVKYAIWLVLSSTCHFLQWQRPTRKPCCGRETARCCCKIWHVSKFIAASRSPICDSTASCSIWGAAQSWLFVVSTKVVVLKCVVGQLTLEKTPAYFVTDNSASRVHQMNSSIRLLVTFRDPVDRAISDYLQVEPAISLSFRDIYPQMLWLSDFMRIMTRVITPG